MRTLNGQVALVTGSSRGIGEAIVTELARRGAGVAVHGRDQTAVNNAVTAIHRDGGEAVGVTGARRPVRPGGSSYRAASLRSRVVQLTRHGSFFSFPPA